MASQLERHPVLALLLKNDGEWGSSEDDPFFTDNHQDIMDLKKRGLISHVTDGGFGAFETLRLTREGRMALSLTVPETAWSRLVRYARALRS